VSKVKFLILIALLLPFSACSSGENAETPLPTGQPIPAEQIPAQEAGTQPTPEVATMEAQAPPPAQPGRYTDMYDFQSPFLSALTAVPRDYAYLQQTFMASEFSIADMFSIETIPAAEAVERLTTYYLPPVNIVSYDLNVDPASRLGQAPPPADYYIYSTGWGPDGSMSAVLMFDRGPGGYIYWSGVQVFTEQDAGLPPVAPDPVWGFKQALILALGAPRDYPGLTHLMGDSFEIMIYYGNGEQMAPQDAVTALENAFLPPSCNVTFEEGDYNQLIGFNPYQMYVSVTDFAFSRGWGPECKDEALLYIVQRPDGSFYWGGVLLAYEGFVK
jgi:hypothetical protein